MDDLVTWLSAQLDEDERVARAVQEECRIWHWAEHDETVTAGPPGGTSYVACGPYEGAIEAEYAAHIARWHPARVLVEVEAKRAVLDDFRSTAEWADQVGGTEGHFAAHAGSLLEVIRTLALPYRDRPGFKEGWLHA